MNRTPAVGSRALILSQARQARAHRCQKVKKPGFKSSRQHHCNLKINLIQTSGGRNGHCGSIPVLHGTRTSSRHAFSGATQEFFALLPVALCYEDTVCRSTKPATPSHLETGIRLRGRALRVEFATVLRKHRAGATRFGRKMGAAPFKVHVESACRWTSS